jgi:sulfofructose kinase
MGEGEPYVVCIGLATLDTILSLPQHPEPDGRVVATELVRAGGGPAATAAVTLARLGVRVYFVGAVGDDDVGGALSTELQDESVDVSDLATVPGAISPQSTILVQAGERTIVHFPGSTQIELSARAEELCHGAAWVHVDHAGYDVAPHGVRLSIDGGNVIDGLELRGVALYAPTERALSEQFGDAQRALAAGAELVVVTRGEKGSAAYTPEGRVTEVPSRALDVVSTLGAGDVFHGALLVQLLDEAQLADALAFANTCAALSCRALDGRSAIPTLEEVAA